MAYVPVAQLVHTLLPVAPVYFPVGQFWQDVAIPEESLYCPFGQTTHAPALVPPHPDM